MNRVVSLATATVGTMVLVSASLVAEERSCTGRIGRVTLDNLRVPAGATCTLDRTHLKGTIVVERGATLQATGIRVNGNIQAEGARAVHLHRASDARGRAPHQRARGASVGMTSQRNAPGPAI